MRDHAQRAMCCDKTVACFCDMNRVYSQCESYRTSKFLVWWKVRSFERPICVRMPWKRRGLKYSSGMSGIHSLTFLGETATWRLTVMFVPVASGGG